MPFSRHSAWTPPAIASLIALAAVSQGVTWLGIMLLPGGKSNLAIGLIVCVGVLIFLPLLLLRSKLANLRSFQLFLVFLALIALMIAFCFGFLMFEGNFGVSYKVLLVAGWIVAPVPLMAWLAATLVGAKGQWFFIGGLVLAEGARLWFYGVIDWRESLAGLNIIFMPVYQYVVVTALLCIAWLIGFVRTSSAPPSG